MNYEETLENSVKDELVSEVKKIVENQKCIDCSAKKPTWASVNLGLFICLDCAGKLYAFVFIIQENTDSTLSNTPSSDLLPWIPGLENKYYSCN
jgi:uncharacterized membrane protein